MKSVFATVVSGWYQYYIPIFVYSIKRAYPLAGVRVYMQGKLDKPIRDILAKMRTERWCGGKWRVAENSFHGYPIAGSNALRLLLPPDDFVNYQMLHLWDVDYIILPHTPSLSTYMNRIMKRSGVPYACFKGPGKAPRRPDIAPNGWNGNFTRVVHGISGFRIPEFFEKTKEAREQYRTVAKHGTHDGDRHKFGSYREYDEVMFARMLKMSGLPLPKTRGVYLDGTKWGSRYRDIHLGDFRMDRWRSKKKMAARYSRRNIRKFRELEVDLNWQEVVAACVTNGNVNKVMRRLRKWSS